MWKRAKNTMLLLSGYTVMIAIAALLLFLFIYIPIQYKKNIEDKCLERGGTLVIKDLCIDVKIIPLRSETDNDFNDR